METPAFDTIAQSLSSTLHSLEQKRIELKKQGHSTGLWVGGIIVVIGAVFSIYIHAALIGICITIGIALFTYISCISSMSQELSTYYKQEVIAKVLESFCDDAVFTPNQGIDESVFNNSCLFTSPDRYHTEDLIEGRIGKTEFCCAEVHAEERKTSVNSKGQTSTYWVDIFKGFLFIADFHKDFQGRTTIVRNSLFKINFSGSRVKLENPDFEKAFDVYSTDQVEARYLLSTSMMERLLALDRDFNSSIKVSFFDSKILIAIPDSKNHFEASIWKSINNLDQLQSDFSTIRALVTIVEELNLNTRIWSKK